MFYTNIEKRNCWIRNKFESDNCIIIVTNYNIHEPHGIVYTNVYNVARYGVI